MGLGPRRAGQADRPEGSRLRGRAALVTNLALAHLYVRRGREHVVILSYQRRCRHRPRFATLARSSASRGRRGHAAARQPRSGTPGQPPPCTKPRCGVQRRPSDSHPKKGLYLMHQALTRSGNTIRLSLAALVIMVSIAVITPSIASAENPGEASVSAGANSTADVGLGRKFAHVSAGPGTLALPRKAGASSPPARPTASRPKHASR
jgi:hypothetical protein